MSSHTEAPETVSPEFSLFDEDNLNRIFTALGFRSQGVARVFFRSVAIFVVTWCPGFLLSMIDGVMLRDIPRESFLMDLAAYGQTFLGYPLFLAAEQIVNRKTKNAAHSFISSGVIEARKLIRITTLHDSVRRLRQLWLADIVCIALAYSFSFLWINEEIHNGFSTWHALGPPGAQTITWAGWWACLVGVPLLNYWWLRWMWRICIWCWYLSRIADNKLRVIATHPDKTGGLGFISAAQTSFGAAIFAFGCSVITATIIHKIRIEGASFSEFSLWGPAIGFAIGAPVLFTLPLLQFTKHLLRAKKRAKHLFDEQAAKAALLFEQKWLADDHDRDKTQLFGEYLSGISNLSKAYDIIESMRVVPFDVRSFLELVGSAVGPILLILPYLGDIPRPVYEILELLKK